MNREGSLVVLQCARSSWLARQQELPHAAMASADTWLPAPTADWKTDAVLASAFWLQLLLKQVLLSPADVQGRRDVNLIGSVDMMYFIEASA